MLIAPLNTPIAANAPRQARSTDASGDGCGALSPVGEGGGEVLIGAAVGIELLPAGNANNERTRSHGDAGGRFRVRRRYRASSMSRRLPGSQVERALVDRVHAGDLDH